MSAISGPRACRRDALRLAAGATATLWLTACGAAGPTGARGEITLHFQGAGPTDLNPTLLAEFEARHPGVRVAATLPPAPATRDQQLISAFVAGSGPDVFWSAAPWAFARGPWLLDLSRLVQDSGFELSAFPASQLLAYRRQGGLYGLPRTCNPSVFVARTDIWASAGIPLPTGHYTAAELAATWARFTERGRRAGGELDWSPTSTYYLRGFGAHLVDPTDDLRCVVGSPAAQACGTWIWQRFWRDGSARGTQGQNGWAAFGQGSLGMALVSAAALPGATQVYANFPWRLVPFPRWPAGNATSTTSEFYGIHAGTAHRTAAWALLQFVVSAPWQRASITAGLIPPARLQLWPHFLTALGQRVPALQNQPLPLLAAGVVGGWAYPPETFRYQDAALPILTGYWTRVFGTARGLPVVQGLPAAAAAVDTAEARAARAASRPGGATTPAGGGGTTPADLFG